MDKQFMKSIIFVGLMIVISACGVVIPTAVKVEDYVSMGEAAFQAGQYEDAFSLYSKAINENVDLSRAHAGRGGILSVWRRYEEAASEFTKSLNHVRSPETLAGRCNAYRFLALYEKAKADCDEALQLNPDSVDANIAYAMLAYAMGNTEVALKVLENASANNPESSLLLYSIGQIYSEQGNLEQAINYLTQAIDEDPNQAQYYCDRGFLFYSIANLDSSEKDFEKVVELGIEGKDDECMFKAGSLLEVLQKSR